MGIDAFVYGAGMVFDLGGTSVAIRSIGHRREMSDDARALARDWTQVAGDLSRAADRVSEQARARR